eukprot:2708003-Prymnesium_polylepis.1
MAARAYGDALGVGDVVGEILAVEGGHLGGDDRVHVLVVNVLPDEDGVTEELRVRRGRVRGERARGEERVRGEGEGRG